MKNQWKKIQKTEQLLGLCNAEMAAAINQNIVRLQQVQNGDEEEEEHHLRRHSDTIPRHTYTPHKPSSLT